MKTTTLISLGIGGTAALTGAGVTLSHFYGGESIRAYIEKTKTSKNKVFLISSNENLDDIKKKYEASDASKRPKPKDDKGQPIDKERLVGWCKDNVDSKFSNKEDPIYLGILSWCFVNSKTISEEMDSRGRELYSKKGETDAEWQKAWANYERNKTDSSTIKVDNSSKLNGDNKEEGGKALHKWCNDMKIRKNKLYEDDEETNYVLFDQWCAKDKD